LPAVLREDHLMRMIRQLAAALARIAGLRKAALLDQAEEELDAAMASLGGIDPRLAEASDAAVLAALVRDPARREALSRLLAERAENLEARGEPVRAEAARGKSRALASPG
jgi:hypothetical protein